MYNKINVIYDIGGKLMKSGRRNRRNKRNKGIKFLLIIVAVLVVGVMIKNATYIFQDLAEAVQDKGGQSSSKVDKEEKPSKKDQEQAEKDRLEEERLEKERLEKERLEEEERIRQEEEAKKAEEEERARQEEEARKAEEARKDPNRKVAYLTFDDGPSRRSTPAVLDILDSYNIKATFFVVGNMIKENPEILKDTHDRGHQIGNHSYSHDYKYLYSSADNFMADIYKTEKLIRSIIGEDFDSKIIRFPGGSFEKRKDPMKKAANEAGYNYIDWNALNGDAEGKKRNKTELLNRLKETVGGQKKIVVLMHDTDAKDTTVEYLRDAIDYLINEGYEFYVLDKNYQ